MINYSAGISAYTQTFFDALVAARDAGVLCVASAGNDAVDTDEAPHYPASYDIESVISVASTERTDALSSFSNWGPMSVDLGAPGSSIVGTVPPVATLFFEDFQTAAPPDIGSQFTREGPANYWGTVDMGDGDIWARGDAEQSYPYRPDADGWIVTPPLDTANLRGLTLSFNCRFEMEEDDDALIGEVWDGTSWQELLRVSSREDPEDRWIYKTDLEPFRNPAMQVRIGWQTDSDGNDFFGAVVDNVLMNYVGSDYTDDTAYGNKSGTSMAAPHVAGAAALLLAESPDMCLTELRNRLVWAGDPLSALAGLTVSGRRLNVYNAMTAPSDRAIRTPNGGEYWVLGSTRAIGWSVFDCDPADPIDVYLLKGGAVYSQLADDAPNTGTFLWNIPEDLPAGGDYRVRIDDGTTVEESDANFTLRGSDVLLYVDDDAPVGGDGLSWNTAYTYLQDALAASLRGDEVRVAGGTYKPDASLQGTVTPGDPAATFQLVGGVGLYGGYAGLSNPGDPDLRDIRLYESILSGDINTPGELSDNSCHVVTAGVTLATPVLDGFTLTGGYASGDIPYHGALGGGMYNESDSEPTIVNCTFRGNSAVSSGGGMYSRYYSAPTVMDCVFSGNSSGRGGGMYNQPYTRPTVTRCTFSENSASSEGGGMYNATGDTMLTDCTFDGNTAEVGGGLWNYRDATLSGCAFHSNAATGAGDLWGGGLYTTSSDPALTNCSFSGNFASLGGAMLVQGGSPTLTNCTFSRNTASSAGGAVYSLENANVRAANCVLWGDSPDEFYNAADSGLEVTWSNVDGGTGQLWFGIGCIDADPLFVDSDGPDGIPGNEDDNLRLSANSPCIEAGDNAVVTAATDLRGNPRIMDGDSDGTPIVDMGAYEYFIECNDNGLIDTCDVDCAALGGACNVPGCGASTDCDTSGVPDECEAGGLDDCNANGTTDWCDIESGVSGDCDANAIPDDCDIAAGTFEDLDLNGIPDVCECAAVSEAPVPESVVYAKNRYLSFEPRNAGEQTAIRVKPLALLPGFEALEGNSLWVGVPRDISEVSGSSDATPPTFKGAMLTCEPFYTDWGSVGLLHAYGDAIMPGGIFEIQAIHETCFTGAEANYSEALVVPSSGVWGDIVGDCAAVSCTPPDGQCNFDDISAVVDKFRNFPGAPIKARADLAPMTPDGIVDFVDIPVAVDAFRGLDYPFYGPGGCP